MLGGSRQLVPHGNGTCHYGNGNVYSGEFRDGIRIGQGTMNYANGNSYEGEWANDC